MIINSSQYMDKLRMKSLDAVEGNVAKIAALCPHCVTDYNACKQKIAKFAV